MSLHNQVVTDCKQDSCIPSDRIYSVHARSISVAMPRSSSAKFTQSIDFHAAAVTSSAFIDNSPRNSETLISGLKDWEIAVASIGTVLVIASLTVGIFVIRQARRQHIQHEIDLESKGSDMEFNSDPEKKDALTKSISQLKKTFSTNRINSTCPVNVLPRANSSVLNTEWKQLMTAAYRLGWYHQDATNVLTSTEATETDCQVTMNDDKAEKTNSPLADPYPIRPLSLNSSFMDIPSTDFANSFKKSVSMPVLSKAIDMLPSSAYSSMPVLSKATDTLSSGAHSSIAVLSEAIDALPSSSFDSIPVSSKATDTLPSSIYNSMSDSHQKDEQTHPPKAVAFKAKSALELSVIPPSLVQKRKKELMNSMCAASLENSMKNEEIAPRVLNKMIHGRNGHFVITTDT
ncbi:hypothetical protein RO3G_07410 [Rhizopus delemar RA 99-880]|uniref:Uncharacterized protein n=3 Tax=Rhizopus TaxID=4842 RepID=I1C2M5_RHIO9|nr:hypothetical protein RO3G_07410 [Rhizopus delemar RA 99-880]|eukprot:EIE82705.1 hypothetical protein RO3G_07410 [Rhizopus delemar RA 99-880]